MTTSSASGEPCSKTSAVTLTPAQLKAAQGLLSGISACDVMVLRSESGRGRTTVLRNVHQSAGGVFVGIRQFLDALIARSPAAIEEAFLALIEDNLATHDLVIVDDLHLLTSVVTGCDYPRPNLLDLTLTAILDEAARRNKKLLFAVDEDDPPQSVRRRAFSWAIEDFQIADYEGICRGRLGGAADGLDYAKLYRFAPKLNVFHLKKACVWLKNEGGLNTERFIDYLRSQMTNSVQIDEVAPVDWNDLKGVDGLIQSLEAKIALPLENDVLAAELHLKPKRGVLLAGPPGTGKTTIGRALAHRLKSKFFLIDGTVVAGSRDFYGTVHRVFEAAKANAPSIIFIDDSDVIFEGNEEHGFYRYLLTMLDGLESASAERVCVMMTAMNVNSLPPALVRSGRIELWLETQLPDTEARAAILRDKLAPLPLPIGAADTEVLAAASRGLTGADLKAVVEDGKLLFAHDIARGKQPRAAEEYYLEAIKTVRANRRNYARSKPAKLTEVVKLGFSAG